MMRRSLMLGGALWLTLCSLMLAADPPLDTRSGDRMLAAYFSDQTARLEDACLADVTTLQDWESRRQEYRRQLLEMLGLDPLPPRTDLKAHVTGVTEHEAFVVERLQFQSRPGLYVTANLYRPREVSGKLPAVLYVCGHGRVAENGISYGNKVQYQHHGAWFARNGYVCLTIDTLQLGEIEGIHHGTYRYGRWWWLNHGYTPAGVEAWNCIRALDYLQAREDVDGQRLGVTGRSGGGAYSWWIAAIDDRIQAAVPVAGITDLRNHVVDGCVEGHCDCMYMVNTYRWDYPLVAALIAPRPLLISNTDSDRIFPLDGVVRTFEKVRRIYRLYGAEDKVALNITAGGHKDTQELRVHAFRWLNQHLKSDDSLIEKTAVKFFQPRQLRVFEDLPADEQNTTIDESFVARAETPLPQDAADWRTLRDGWRDVLLRKSFAAWPTEAIPPLDVRPVWTASQEGVDLSAFDFTSQQHVRLRLHVAHRAGLEQPKLVVLNVLDETSWRDFLAMMRPAFAANLSEAAPGSPGSPDDAPSAANGQSFDDLRKMFQAQDWAMAYVAPRGIGPTAWDQSERKQTQHQRRFYLLGQTLDGMRIWDVRRAVQTLRTLPPLAESPLWLQSHRRMAGVSLYASLFEPDIKRLDLYQLPATHQDGPCLLNASRFLEVPQVVAMAAERSQVVLYDDPQPDWEYPRQTAERLGWDPKQLRVRKPPQ